MENHNGLVTTPAGDLATDIATGRRQPAEVPADLRREVSRILGRLALSGDEDESYLAAVGTSIPRRQPGELSPAQLRAAAGELLRS